MLIQFRFKNFKSFRDDAILDFSATKITEHADRVVQDGKEKILPVAAIYGANASGKSNVIEAFQFMATYVSESFGYGGEDDKMGRNKRPKPTPFLFDSESRSAESSFEVYFTEPGSDSGKVYNYGFCLNADGVTEEWLNVRSKSATESKPIFYRNHDELDLSGITAKQAENIRVSLQKEALVVSLGAKLKSSKLKMVHDCFEILFLNDDSSLLAFETCVAEFQHEFLNSAAAYLASFDASIIGLHAEARKDDQFELPIIKTIHQTTDEHSFSLPLEEESSGTLKMLSLYPSLYYVLTFGGILVVDELNAKLHPLLVRNFLLQFLNPQINTHHAQLLFTTHDSWLLSNNLLRRDEIWFTEKDEQGISTLYSLADFYDEDGEKIRKDENYEKNYLLGKYGAIPTLKDLVLPGEMENG